MNFVDDTPITDPQPMSRPSRKFLHIGSGKGIECESLYLRANEHRLIGGYLSKSLDGLFGELDRVHESYVN